MAYGGYTPNRSIYQEFLLTGYSIFLRDFPTTSDGLSLLSYRALADNPLRGRRFACSSGHMIVYPGRWKRASGLWRFKMIMSSSKIFHAARCFVF